MKAAGKEKRNKITKRHTESNEQNGNNKSLPINHFKCITLNNHFKCKWVKLPNQKI